MKKSFNKEEIAKIIESKNYNALMDYDLVGADFRSFDLTCADLSHLDLDGAIFDGMKLNGVNFEGARLDNASFVEADCTFIDFNNGWINNADFSKAYIGCCCFNNAKLEDASFDFVKASITDFSHIWARKVSFRNANLYACNFDAANMDEADLYKAHIRGSSFCETSLCAANVTKVLSDERVKFFALQCPEEGSFIGFKHAGGKIVKLRITEDAFRASGTTRRCRCSKAEVLSITEADGRKSDVTSVASDYDENFIYEVGKTVETKVVFLNRWLMDIHDGIQFYITRQEAVDDMKNYHHMIEQEM